jgi:hypothetical protein
LEGVRPDPRPALDQMQVLARALKIRLRTDVNPLARDKRCQRTGYGQGMPGASSLSINSPERDRTATGRSPGRQTAAQEDQRRETASRVSLHVVPRRITSRFPRRASPVRRMSFRFDARCLKDRPPFVDLGRLKCAQRLGRL